jgi:uncharacterized Ntn-hydrolase superfamily protein
MTASIVARDPGSGELGVAVFTAWPGVGMHVPFAEAGVGAVATQAMVERSFGPRGLEMLRAGVAPEAIVEQLIGGDPAPATRQLAVLSADGELAGHTGAACVPFTGETTGAGYRCQANMMAREGVTEAMGAAFEAAEGELSLQLLAALEAGQHAGGDARGQMSAALLVVPATGAPWDVVVELRVDFHERPLEQLRRALDYHRAFTLLDAATEHAEEGHAEAAMRAGMEALSLVPDDGQLLLWLGLGAAAGDLEVGVELVRRALALAPALAGFLERMPAAVMPAAPAVRARLAAEAAADG